MGVGYGDQEVQKAWETGLSPTRRYLLEDMKVVVAQMAPDMRRGLMRLLVEAELAEGRRAYAIAYKAEETFKASLIRANGKQLVAQVATLSGLVDRALEKLEAYRAVGWLLRDASTRALDQMAVVAMADEQLRRVAGPWFDVPWGAEKGEHISGYGAPQPADRAPQREARVKQVVAKKAAVEAAVAPVVQAAVEQQRVREAELAPLLAASEAAWMEQPEPEDTQQPSLFGRRS